MTISMFNGPAFYQYFHIINIELQFQIAKYVNRESHLFIALCITDMKDIRNLE